MGIELAKLSLTDFRYAEVEVVLVEHFRVQEASLGIFRARIRQFQKLGIIPFRAGRGKYLEYKLIDVVALAFCLSLSELSVAPSAIKTIYDNEWNEVRNDINKVYEGNYSFLIAPSFLSQATGGDHNASLSYANTYITSKVIDLSQIDRGLFVNVSSLVNGIAHQLSRRSPSPGAGSRPRSKT